MQIDSKSAIIDNDFLNHAIDTRMPCGQVAQILSEVFCALEVDPLIHPLVFKNEVMKTNARTTEILSKNVIKIPTMEDIHQNDETKKAYYSFLVLELYKKLTGSQLAIGHETVFSFWKKNMSLGEIHSLSTCIMCGCGIFLSDDGDSQELKNIIKNDFLTDIAVHNRQTVVSILREKGTSLSRSELRSFAHVR